MGNSTIKLSDIVDDASTLGDVAPALATGGYSSSVAMSVANDVMNAMLLGGASGQPFNWKFNRILIPPFPTISWQQDYFIPGLVNLGWLENGWAVNINQTSIPKQKIPLEINKDLDVTYAQSGYPDKIAWILNSQCITGVWGQAPLGPTAGFPSGQIATINPSDAGYQNPGPGVIYTNPLGANTNPANACNLITDPNGNLWVVTQYGTCGMTQPSWPTTPVYPTYQLPNIVATTITDGTVIWTAINPQGQGIRLNPIPPQTGVVWMINLLGQTRVPVFKTLDQLLDPIPDDWVTYWKQGFFCECYRRNPDSKVRSRYPEEYKRWMQSLNNAVSAGNRERDDYGFYPTSAGVMESSWYPVIRPDYPYNTF